MNNKKKFKNKFSPSVRKYIRREKARLRKQISDRKEFKQKVEELYKRFIQV